MYVHVRIHVVAFVPKFVYTQELYTTPYDSIDWSAQRSNIAPGDIYTPHSKVLDLTLGKSGHVSDHEDYSFCVMVRYVHACGKPTVDSLIQLCTIRSLM